MKRTPLRGRTRPMRRVPLRDRPPRGPKTAPTSRARRDTGPSAKTRTLVAARAGYCCELCGLSLYIQDIGWTTAYSLHHRRPRGAGGSRAVDTNTPPNLLLVCGSATSPGGCHHRIESDRLAAINAGWLVPQGHAPASVPVVVRGRQVLLTDDGCYADLDGNHDHGHGPCTDCNPDGAR